MKVENNGRRSASYQLRWFGHVKRIEQEHDCGKKGMELALSGNRRRGRPKQRWLECVMCKMLELWGGVRRHVRQGMLEGDGAWYSDPTWKREQLEVVDEEEEEAGEEE